ncbi:MAG: anthranilate synthase component I [Anaerolineae bacterium]
MYKPSLDHIRTLAGQGNVIPITRELPADLETPVSVYLKLRDGSPSFLLESVEKGEQMGRYSFIGVQAPLALLARGNTVTMRGAGGAVLETRHTDDPLDVLRTLLRQRTAIRPPDVDTLPRFTGGAVGYLSYDWVRFVERLPATATDDLDLPEFVFLLADNLVIFDHVRHRLLVLANCRLEGDPSTGSGQDLLAAYADAVARIEQIVARLRKPLVLPEEKQPEPAGQTEWQSNVSQTEFENRVLQAKEHIAAGDIFQVVLSQRLSRTTHADPFTIYRALRMTNPSPYMYFLELPDGDASGQPLRLIGSSPEMHVRLDANAGKAQLHPIAGTRWRGATVEEDAELAAGLLADPKERAEHVMLVDLGRNDLGRVCDYGSVHIPTLMAVERYSHVMHIVSDVQGTLRPEFDAFDLLRATFPAGTVSGAPKVRAMEIIETLEGTRRGPYAGCVGYIGYDGTMDTCITIRTVLMRGQTCTVQAGAGIVADSDPTYEWQETLNKTRALAVAVEVAERGLVAG